MMLFLNLNIPDPIVSSCFYFFFFFPFFSLRSPQVGQVLLVCIK